VSAWSRWWSVSGSDPLWWPALPLVVVFFAFGALLYAAAGLIRLIVPCPHRLRRIADAPMGWLWGVREQRALRRQLLWENKQEAGSLRRAHVHGLRRHLRAMRGLSKQDGQRPPDDAA
jgi:hypothetical protein